MENKKVNELKIKLLKDLNINPIIEQVTNEIDYMEKLNFYNGKLKKLSKEFKKMIYHPDEFINEIEIIFGEMVGYGVISLEFANKERLKIYKELNEPQEFLEWIKDRSVLRKIQRRLNKK